MNYSVLLCLVLSACTATSIPVLQETKKPVWINAPADGCLPDEICAVGTGAGMRAAETDARIAIAKIFETKISSSLTSKSTVSGNRFDSTASEHITETSDAVLNAVEIKKTYEAPDAFYAFAVLDKLAAAETVEKEMQNLDTQMTLLFKEETLPAAIQTGNLYEQRNILNMRYRVLTGSLYPETVSYEQTAAYKAKMFKHKKISLTAAKNDAALLHAVQEALSKAGYIIVSRTSADVPAVSVTVNAEEEYINVDGFHKYTFYFKITSPGRDNSMVEAAAASFTESGRSYGQAYGNALAAFKSYLTTNIPVF